METITTPSGYAVPVTWFAGQADAPAILLMGALGVPAGFYTPLAERLAGAGLQVALMEHRGYGHSALRASRETDWGFAEPLDNDMPAVMAWIRERAPGVPLWLMGHSLGGHYAAMTAGLWPERVDAVIQVACASPWLGGFRGLNGLQLRLLVSIIPVSTALLGYYPGTRIGFGGREARTLMADWRDLAKTNRYSARGLSDNLDTGIADYTGPVLAIRLADDPFAPAAGVRAVTDKFRSARLEEQVITAEQLGDRADHFRWARRPGAVVEAVQRWSGR